MKQYQIRLVCIEQRSSDDQHHPGVLPWEQEPQLTALGEEGWEPIGFQMHGQRMTVMLKREVDHP